MNLTAKELRFLTALAREHNQSGCRGPAHDLLRRHAYPEVPREGPASLTFAYDAVPLTAILLRQFQNLEEIDGFLRRGELISDPVWPWASADEYRARLNEAKNANSPQRVPAA